LLSIDNYQSVIEMSVRFLRAERKSKKKTREEKLRKRERKEKIHVHEPSCWYYYL